MFKMENLTFSTIVVSGSICNIASHASNLPFVKGNTLIELFHDGVCPSLEPTSCPEQASTGTGCFVDEENQVIL